MNDVWGIKVTDGFTTKDLTSTKKQDGLHIDAKSSEVRIHARSSVAAMQKLTGTFCSDGLTQTELISPPTSVSEFLCDLTSSLKEEAEFLKSYRDSLDITSHHISHDMTLKNTITMPERSSKQFLTQEIQSGQNSSLDLCWNWTKNDFSFLFSH